MMPFSEDSLFDISDFGELGRVEDKKISCSKIVTVALDTGVDDVFDYLLPDRLGPISPGRRLEVPFGRANKIITGFCVEVKDAKSYNQTKRKLKFVKKILDAEPLLDDRLLRFGRWISDFYVCPLGQVLSAMVPAAVKKGTGVKMLKHIYLTTGKKNIHELIDKLRGKKQKQIIQALKNADAFDKESAIESKSLLKQLNSGLSPLNKLIETGTVKLTGRAFIKELPVIPKGLLLRAGKVILNNDQKKALGQIENRIESDKFSVVLLHGVTDSGKTEVYIRAIEKAVKQGKSAIVLLPEITLTTQTIQRFSSRFENIAVMHCRLTASQRNAQWQKIKTTSPIVVIGARSAVFAPVDNPGVVIVDEEHEPSYKQDMAPRYNGRDAAIKLAQLSNAVCILGSATPCLETLYNCKTKNHFTRLALPKRVMGLERPQMKIIDMTKERFELAGVNLISSELLSALKQVLERKEQAILLLNRRGYSNFIYCPSCKYTLKCKNCDVTLTFHKTEKHQKPVNLTGRLKGGFAVCHYCLAQTLVPKNCPICNKAVTMIGLGSQRLEDELASKLPNACVVRVDSDSMQNHDYYRLLSDFDSGKIDILAGTQILAKGLHFPNVTLVGIISADTSLQLPDFRANERTYHLICQVAGRAGRSKKGGTVFVQTFLPNQPAIKFAVEDDFEGFLKEELLHRKNCLLPPFGRVALVRMKDIKYDRLNDTANFVAQQLINIISSHKLDIKLTGPMPSTIARIQRFSRMQIILQTADISNFSILFGQFRRLKSVNSAVGLQVDVDPVNLL
ncbi:MAG: primosomal protein N' [Sedimentisphaerales bacterium]|nr:primosomal protein N' [Sedimentisphaerales bacterium]